MSKLQTRIIQALKVLVKYAPLLVFLLAAVSFWYEASFRTWNIFQKFPSNPFDAQAVSFLQGKFAIDPKQVWYEKFITPSGVMIYYGIIPVLLRIPILVFYEAAFGHLASLFCWLASMITLGFTYKIILLNSTRGKNILHQKMFQACVLATVAFGSPISFLISVPTVYQESLLWAVAFSTTSIYFILSAIHENKDHSLLASVAFSCTLLTRVTFAAPFFLFSGICFLRCLISKNEKPNVSRVILVRLPLVFALFLQMAVNQARFDSPFVLARFEQWEQETIEFAQKRAEFGTFSLQRVHIALKLYLLGSSEYISEQFPYSKMMWNGHVSRPKIFFGDNSESFLPLALSAPWMTLSILLSLILLGKPRYRLLVGLLIMQICLICAHYAITYRYTTEFIPLALVGLYARTFIFNNICRRLVYAVMIILFAASIVLHQVHHQAWINTQSMIPDKLRKK